MGEKLGEKRLKILNEMLEKPTITIIELAKILNIT
ncbi:MAG TPA: winged helix-turn-helix transcriptional regulator [Bacteroidetes bacterium]|nr:winged helix-turn-helix transcriptional regulator [Bacteroidota bacterium]